MGRVYTVPINSETVGTGAQDLVSFQADSAAGYSLVILDWEITSDATVASIVEPIQIVRRTGTATLGTGGQILTAELCDDNIGSTATFVSHARDTTQASGGTATQNLSAYAWEGMGMLGKTYLPEARYVVHPGNTIALTANPTTAFEMSGTFLIEER